MLIGVDAVGSERDSGLSGDAASYPPAIGGAIETAASRGGG
jgi:hypothetical protein